MADTKNAKLILSVETKGTEAAGKELKKVSSDTTTIAQELGKISRANQLQGLAKEMGVLAAKTGDTVAAVIQFDARLKALGATKREVQGLASAFQSAAKEARELAEAEASAAAGGAAGGGASAAGGLSFGQKVTRLGAQGRNLPSFQLPGMPIATDAISNLTRLGGVIIDVGGKSQAATAAVNLLTPALGAQTAATVGAAAPVVLFVAGLAAIGLALNSLTVATGQNAEAITAYAEAQRGLNADIVEGLTTEEAQKEIEDLSESRRLEAELLAKNKAAYAEFEKQATDAGTSVDDFGSTLTKIIVGANAVSDVAKVISADEQAIADQIAAGEKNVKDLEARENTLIAARDSGRLAANDAAEAEKKLAEERSKAALASADTAAKELQSQQKALNATEDQNKKRLETIEEEKAVVQKQIDTLTESGVTSEEVTAKLAALNGQLGSLGKESEFIKNTALEVSRQADAEKKAKKDAEDAAKKAEQAQEQYTKAVDSATRTYKQSVEDIGTRLRQTLADNTLKLNRDLTDIATKYRRDEYDLTIKANRAERDALQDQLDDLDDMRRDALKDEQQAIQEGDFKALFLARQKGAETVQQEAAEIERDRQKRQQNAEDARADLLRAAERQRSDRVMGYDRQNMDARTAQQRELQQAVTTRQRALQVATEGLNAELKQLGNYYAARLKMDQQYQNNSLKIASGGGSQGANANSPFGAMQSTFRAMGGVIRK